MTLDEKLAKLEIKRILVADDLPDNIAAAKDAFSKYSGLHVDYASSATNAKQKISDTFQTSKYDLILTDMNMESSSSGFEVMNEAMKYHTLAAIVTGIDPTTGGHAHGAQTKVMISGYEHRLDGNKSEPKIWSEVLEGVTDYLSSDGSSLYKSMQRYHKHIDKPSGGLKDLFRLVYEK